MPRLTADEVTPAPQAESPRNLLEHPAQCAGSGTPLATGLKSCAGKCKSERSRSADEDEYGCFPSSAALMMARDKALARNLEASRRSTGLRRKNKTNESA